MSSHWYSPFSWLPVLDQLQVDATMLPMDPEVRDAVDGDAVEIAGLLSELGYPQSAGQLRSGLKAATDSRHFVLVAALDGRLVGVLSAAVIPLLAESTPMVRITSLSVSLQVRGRGVGRALVETAERRARDVGALVVEVSSGRRPDRVAAHRFYPALGFEDTNTTSVRYWKRLDRGRDG
jgi:GNAT superfamily N-acetyltransferase